MTIHVRTPSRLHFGLVVPASNWKRRFGGAGLMIDAPGIELRLTPADSWTFEGPLAERVEEAVRLLQSHLNWLQGEPPHRILVEHAAPEHVGLGTGTQLSLAVARAVLEAVPHRGINLAGVTWRGARSGIGVHGFQRGGFLVDGGKHVTGYRRARHGRVAPLVARVPFPDAWRVVLVLPVTAKGLAGMVEGEAFEALEPCSLVHRDAQCGRLLMDILPALVEQEFDDFSEALYLYNRAAGEMFRNVQGGAYASPAVEALVTWIRNQGVQGVGQSSWGPAVFAITRDQTQANRLANKLREWCVPELNEIIVTQANNEGARVWEDKG